MTDSVAATKPKHKFKISERGYVAFPAFFIDEMMPLALHVPPSFWKYLLVLWRDINHHKEHNADKSMRQFHVRSEDASRWTSALFVSGLFDMKYGWKHIKDDSGKPTKFTYHPETDFTAWEIFFMALEEQVVADKRGYEEDGLRMTFNDTAEGFRAELLLRIQRIQYKQHGIKPRPEQIRLMKVYTPSHCRRVGYDEQGNSIFRCSRLPKTNRGVLNLAEQLDGSYPRRDEPLQDDDTGKVLRAYRDAVYGPPIVIPKDCLKV